MVVDGAVAEGVPVAVEFGVETEQGLAGRDVEHAAVDFRADGLVALVEAPVAEGFGLAHRPFRAIAHEIDESGGGDGEVAFDVFKLHPVALDETCAFCRELSHGAEVYGHVAGVGPVVGAVHAAEHTERRRDVGVVDGEGCAVG